MSDVQFLALLQAGSLGSGTDVQNVHNQLRELAEQDRGLFLQHLVLALKATQLSLPAMNFAIVLTRVVLPQKIRINENPFEGLPEDAIVSLMSQLITFFSNENASIRYHSAMSYGKFAAFTLHVTGSSQYIDAVAEHLTSGDEKVATSCAVVLDQIISYSRLTTEQKDVIFRVLFASMTAPECSNVTRELCMSALCQMGKDIVALVRSDPGLYLNSFLEMSAYPLIACSGFLLFSDIAESGYELLASAPGIASLSVKYLQGETKEDLCLNILRFWCFAAQHEIANEGSLRLVANNIEALLPLLFVIFERTYDQWESTDDWCVANAVGNAIVAVCQAEPEKFLAIMSPVISEAECHLPIIVQSLDSLLLSGSEEIFMKIAQPAMDTALRAIQTQEPRTIALGFDILTSLSNFVAIPSDVVQMAFGLLSSGDERVFANVIEFIQGIVVVQGSSLPLAAYVEGLFKIISSTIQDALLCQLIDLIGFILSVSGTNQQLVMGCVQPSLDLCGFLMKKCPNDEPMASVLHLLAKVLRALPEETQATYAEEAVKMIFSLEDSEYRTSALLVLGSFAAVMKERFRPLTEMTFRFIEKVLSDFHAPTEVVAVFRSLTLFLRFCDIGELIQPLISRVVSLAVSPDLAEAVIASALEVLNVAMFYHKESMAQFLDSVVSCLELALKIISSPCDDEMDGNMTVNVVECCVQLLKYTEVPGVAQRVIPISVHVLNIASGADGRQVLVFSVDLLVLLSQMLGKEDLCKLLSTPEIQMIKSSVEKNGDAKSKKALLSVFSSC